ncbi:hypothetical protein TNCV_4925321 [Trichonephila clavipes]|nr:hypothetical protein TNCV_4925321 [Trichonephila clavipes]
MKPNFAVGLMHAKSVGAQVPRIGRRVVGSSPDAVNNHQEEGDNRVVKVSDRGWPCHEFELRTTKTPPWRRAMHVESVESSTVGVVWVVWRGTGASSGVVHIT